MNTNRNVSVGGSQVACVVLVENFVVVVENFVVVVENFVVVVENWVVVVGVVVVLEKTECDPTQVGSNLLCSGILVPRKDARRVLPDQARAKETYERMVEVY